jgi:ribonuclease HI
MESNYIFIDGSCLNNGCKNSKGGYGVFFGDEDPRNICKKLVISPIITKITNNTAELMACLEALNILETNLLENKKNYIVTDSKYLYQSIIDWIPIWEKNNWKKRDGKIIEN